MKKPYIIIFLLFVLSACVVGIIYCYGGLALRVDIQKEIAKVFLQLAAIGIIGAFIKYLFDQHVEKRKQQDEKRERQRMRDNAENEFRREILTRFIGTYRQIRKARIYIEATKSAKTYGEQMRVIIDVRLDISEIMHEIEIARDVFSQTDTIKEHLIALEKYLKELIAEYENSYESISDLQKRYEKDYNLFSDNQRKKSIKDIYQKINELVLLSDFRESPKEGKFFQEYLAHYFKARDELRKQYWVALRSLKDSRTDS